MKVVVEVKRTVDDKSARALSAKHVQEPEHRALQVVSVAEQLPVGSVAGLVLEEALLPNGVEFRLGEVALGVFGIVVDLSKHGQSALMAIVLHDWRTCQRLLRQRPDLE